MSSFDRRACLSLLTLGALGACGFSPAYAPDSAPAALRGKVRMDDPGSIDSFDLVRQVEERLGRPVDPIYGLSITPSVFEESIAIVATRDVTRFNLIGFANYACRDLATGKVLTSGRVESFTSYSAAGTTVSTLTAQRDAQTRLMIILANQVVTRLIVAAENGTL